MTLILGKDEEVQLQTTLRPSIIMGLFQNYTLKLTNKRLIGDVPTYTWILPTGQESITFVLRNISSVETRQKLNVSKIIFGLIFGGLGIAGLSDSFIGGLFFIMIAVLFFYLSRETQINFITNSGRPMRFPVSPLDKNEALYFTNEVNQKIVELL